METMSVAEKKICIIPNGVNRQKFQPLPFKENRQSKLQSEIQHVFVDNLSLAWNLSANDFFVNESASPTADVKPIHLAVVARLDRQKGQDIALRALALLLEKYPNKYKLHFVGEDTPNEDAFLPELQNLAAQLNISEHVFFHGYQPNIEKLLPYFDLLWMPSHKETFGRCLLEAMACRVPVLASRAGGVPDIITHQKNGFLFETKNFADLALQTEKIFSDETLLEKCVQDAFVEIENKYDQEKIWQRLLMAVLPDQVRRQAELPPL